MGLLVLDGRDVSQGRMEPAVVVPIHPAGGGVLDVGDGLVGPVVKDGGADALGLVEPVDRLHQGVVVGVADRADRGPDLLERQVLGQPHRRVLRPGVRVVDQLAGLGGVSFSFALPQRHAQRDHHQVGLLGRRGVPGHDPLGVDVDDEGHVGEPRPGPHVREVRDPGAVRCRGAEVAVAAG